MHPLLPWLLNAWMYAPTKIPHEANTENAAFKLRLLMSAGTKLGPNKLQAALDAVANPNEVTAAIPEIVIKHACCATKCCGTCISGSAQEPLK